jgi:glutathione S-transferase
MPKHRLTYFDYSGSRGEECRLALHLNGVDFEDRRLSRDQWKELKPTTPFGSLPLLEVEGRPPLAQSNAILSFIGRQHGSHPKDPWDAARHEALFCAVEDLRAAVASTGATDDADEKKRRREAFAEGYLNRWCAHVERQIAGPFVEGDAIHLADVKLFVIVSALLGGAYDHVGPEAFASFPKIPGLVEAVKTHPKIAEWRAR